MVKGDFKELRCGEDLQESPDRHPCVLDVVRHDDRDKAPFLGMELHSTRIIDRHKDSHAGVGEI